MRTAAVLPIKTFPRAKTRLRTAVPDPGREDLAAAMVQDVLDALAATAGIDLLVVVTREPEAVAAAARVGATVVPDPDEAGQSAAVGHGLEAAVAAGADRALLVPGDCPALDPAEVAGLLAARDGTSARGVVIVPDRHGTGTNALLLAPPRVIEPGFGPGSFARHAERAAAVDARARVAELPSLQHDVDTPADLLALRRLLARRPGGAVRTRAALERLAPVLGAAS